jgi:hypothetical protein
MWTNDSGNWSSTTSSFSTLPLSFITSPAQGASITPLQTKISWNAVPGVSSYTLWVGTSPGAKDALYFATPSATSTTVNLQPGTTYYTTLWTDAGGTWFNTTSSFQTSAVAYLKTPIQGSTVSPQVGFSWTGVPSATAYTLWVGTSPGASDAAYLPASGTSTSTILLPGTTYNTTLWTNNSGSWSYTTSSFQTSQTAVLTSPSSGATGLDAGAPIAFNWTSISGATEYQLDIGSSVGAKDAYSTRGTTSTSASAMLQPNATYYARIWTDTAGTWSHVDSIFATGNALAHLSYPQNGATGVSQFLPFTWNQSPEATGYTLIVSPTGYGVNDFYVSAGSTLIPTDTSQYVYALQPNMTYYAQLCTAFSAGSACTYSTFTIGPPPPLPPDRNAFYQTIFALTGRVVQMGPEPSRIPIHGSLLEQQMLSYAGNPASGAQCGNFTTTLLNLFTENGILGRIRTLSLDGVEGHVTAEYWDPFNQKWQAADATFGVVFFDPSTQTGQGADDVSNLLVNGQVSSIDMSLATNWGSLYLTSYYMDPITYYVNVQPFGFLTATAEYNYVPNSPLPFLTSVPLSSIEGVAGAYVFNFAQQTDTLQVQDRLLTLTFAPANTEGWYAPSTLHTYWSVSSSVPAGMTTYTHPRVLSTSSPPLSTAPLEIGTSASSPSSVITPANRATVSYTDIQFSWSAVSGATDYNLCIGTQPGANDALFFDSATATSTTATLQPGITYYARLWVQTPQGINFSDSSFKTVP